MPPGGPLLLLAPIAFFWLASPMFGEQEYVTRYDVFAGYAFLDSPHIGLFENGFAFEAGVRPKTWYSVGFDYSRPTGNATLTPDQLPSALPTDTCRPTGSVGRRRPAPPGIST